MTVRLGLIAASRIADEAVIEPAREVTGVEVVAVAARSGDRARQAAERWGLGRWFDSYQALVEDPEIDAIYVATPASLHRRWAIAALEAGKHTLVEKPLAANATDARLMVDVGNGVDRVAMEAFHWRFHPLAPQMKEIIDSGDLGDIERVEGAFLVGEEMIPRDDIRWQLPLGGGAMMDLGIYPAGWLWFVMGERPRIDSASAFCPVEGVDGRLAVNVSWPGGTTGTMTASMVEPGRHFETSLRVTGTRGTMSVVNPLAPQRGASLAVAIGSDIVMHEVAATSTYSHQLEAFRDAIEHGSPFPTTLEAGWQMMEFLDDCYRAAGLDPRPSDLAP